MKKIYFLLFVLINFSCSSFAQFDNRFYYPSSDYNISDTLAYEDMFFEIDTVKLHILFLKPEIKAKISIIFFIGSSGNASDYTVITKTLVDAGYQVFMFEPRGYGKSTGKPTHLNILSDAQIVVSSMHQISSIFLVSSSIYLLYRQ